MEQQESKAPGFAILIGIMITGSGLILVAGGLFGWLVVLLVGTGLICIAAGTATPYLLRWEDELAKREREGLDRDTPYRGHGV